MPDPLNDTEQLILLAIARLESDAYGVSIRSEILERAGRDVSVAAVYAALDRLEERGYLVHRLSEPTAERGGRRKKIYRVTGPGREAVLEARETMARMWEGLDLEAASDRRTA